MKFKLAKKLVDKAFFEDEKEKHFRVYLSDRPYLKEEMNFNQYLMRIGFTQHIQSNFDKRSVDEILNEINEVKAQFKKE